MSSAATATASVVSTEVAELFERFDAIYRESGGDPARIPWAHRRACPAMITWLNAQAPALVRPGARVCVVGSGLGLDAVALADRGYEVTAFDVSEAAVGLARELHPEHASIFTVGDAFDPPGRLRGRFDLVVEVHTLQSLPPETRTGLLRGIAGLLNHRGLLLVVARGREEGSALEGVDGPPWELTLAELMEAAEGAGLAVVGEVDDFMDGSDPPVRRLRGVFRQGG